MEEWRDVGLQPRMGGRAVLGDVLLGDVVLQLNFWPGM